jgi:hypothetical protein
MEELGHDVDAVAKYSTFTPARRRKVGHAFRNGSHLHLFGVVSNDDARLGAYRAVQDVV